MYVHVSSLSCPQSPLELCTTSSRGIPHPSNYPVAVFTNTIPIAGAACAPGAACFVSPRNPADLPSLAAAKLPAYQKLIDAAVAFGKSKSSNLEEQAENAMDRLLVEFGTEILKIVPGRVSTEVDAAFSFDAGEWSKTTLPSLCRPAFSPSYPLVARVQLLMPHRGHQGQGPPDHRSLQGAGYRQEPRSDQGEWRLPRLDLTADGLRSVPPGRVSRPPVPLRRRASSEPCFISHHTPWLLGHPPVSSRAMISDFRRRQARLT
jgi:hypothetical protein